MGGTDGSVEKIGNNTDIYRYANIRVVNFEREYQLLTPGIRILVVPQFSYLPDQILGKNEKNSIFRPKFDLPKGPPVPTYNYIFETFTHELTSYLLD